MKIINSEVFDKSEIVKEVVRDSIYNLYSVTGIVRPYSLIDNMVLESAKIFIQTDFTFRKVKKLIEKEIKKDFNNEVLNSFFGKLGNEIEALKSYGKFKVMFAIEKDVAGRGIYESVSTCFGPKGKGNVFNFNVYAQLFDNNKRYQVLLIQSADGSKNIGRCILFYHGKGKIDVMNIYLKVSLPVNVTNKSFFSDIISKYYGREIIETSDSVSATASHCFYQNSGNFSIFLESLGYNDFTSIPKILSNCCNKRINYDKFQVVEDGEGKNHFICNSSRCESNFYEEHGSNRYICECCGCRVDEDEISHHNGENYCQDCFCEYYFYCDNCHETYSIDELHSTDNASLCENCFDDKYFYCSDCNEIERKDDGIELPNGDLICERCYERNYFTCESCNEIFTSNELKEHKSGYFCESCFEDEYFTCESCDTTFEIAEKVEYKEEFFCKECFEVVYDNLIENFVKNFQTKVVITKNLF